MRHLAFTAVSALLTGLLAAGCGGPSFSDSGVASAGGAGGAASPGAGGAAAGGPGTGGTGGTGGTTGAGGAEAGGAGQTGAGGAEQAGAGGAEQAGAGGAGASGAGTSGSAGKGGGATGKGGAAAAGASGAGASAAAGTGGAGAGGVGMAGAGGAAGAGGSCQPAHACKQDLQCGTADDGCGKALDCGACQQNLVDCGAATPNQCALCDLQTQTGCTPDHKCDPRAGGCVPPGNVGVDEMGSTSAGGDDCKAGLLFVHLLGSCQAYCAHDSDCGDGHACLITTKISGGPFDGAHVTACVKVCDPLGSSGCPSFDSCYANTNEPTKGGLCEIPGTKSRDQPCGAVNDCQPGLACHDDMMGNGKVCRKVCDPQAGPTADCFSCKSLFTSSDGSSSYGVCML